MNFDSSSPYHDAVPEFDDGYSLLEVRQVTNADGKVETAYVWDHGLPARSFGFAHDKQRHRFVLMPSNGKTEYFRDDPTRHLVVAPDPETGEMRPVTRCGQPVYLYLSREEREL
jgi:hypothetical protein